MERVFVDFLQYTSLLERDIPQALTVFEGISPNLFDIPRNSYLFQSTALKARNYQCLEFATCLERNPFQRGTLLKCIPANFLQALRNDELRNTTPIEAFISNVLQSFRQLHFLQSAATLERAILYRL